MKTEIITTETGTKYEFTRIKNDIYGNPRYLVHFLDLGLKDHESNTTTRKAGLKKYKGNCYGGGFVFQSYNLLHSARWFEQLGLCK